MPSRAKTVSELLDDRRPDAELIMATLGQLIESLHAILPRSSEVVLHDLTKLPNSVVAIAGSLTGRKVGDPATDVLLSQVRGASHGKVQPLLYRTVLPDGRDARSTTMIVRSSAGLPVAALCINIDMSSWLTARSLIDFAIDEITYGIDREGDQGDGEGQPQVAPVGFSGEAFVHSVEELADYLIELAMKESDIPVGLMKKQHKLAVVKSLDDRGLFLIRDGVERAAMALQVTRYTIYNYLNELNPDRSIIPNGDRAQK